MTDLAQALSRSKLYDVSPVIDGRLPVFPGHPPLRVEPARTHLSDGYFLQTLELGEHTGSHVDAPAHAVAQLADHTIDVFPVERFVAPYVKLDLTPVGLGAGELATAEMLQEAEQVARPLGTGEIAIVQFGWDVHLRPDSDDPEERAWWIRNAPGLADDACEHLAGRGVGGVGTDTATADAAVVDGVITSEVGHKRWFLPNDILLFEGLVGLARAPHTGLFIGLPLRIKGGSGSPIRAVLVGDA